MAQLKLSRSTVYDLIRSRRLPSLTIGRARRIPASAMAMTYQGAAMVLTIRRDPSYPATSPATSNSARPATGAREGARA